MAASGAGSGAGARPKVGEIAPGLLFPSFRKLGRKVSAFSLHLTRLALSFLLCASVFAASAPWAYEKRRTGVRFFAASVLLVLKNMPL